MILYLFILERKTYSEMECKVSAEIRVNDRIFPLVAVCRIDGFHSSVESDNEKVKIHAEAYSVAYGNLFVELIKSERTAWLVFIVADSPDVAGIDEEGSIELPKEEGSVFKVEVKLDVTRLVNEVYASVGTGI